MKRLTEIFKIKENMGTIGDAVADKLLQNIHYKKYQSRRDEIVKTVNDTISNGDNSNPNKLKSEVERAVLDLLRPQGQAELEDIGITTGATVYRALTSRR